MSTGGIILVAFAIAVGLVGIVVPLLPGTLLVFGAIAVWAAIEHNVTSWVTLGVVGALIAVSTAIKYLWPVRRMRAADVSTWSLVAGAVLGIIGFFVIPVLGLVIGFVLGIYLAELAHRRNQRAGMDVDRARAEGCSALGRGGTVRRVTCHRGLGCRRVPDPVTVIAAAYQAAVRRR